MYVPFGDGAKERQAACSLLAMVCGALARRSLLCHLATRVRVRVRVRVREDSAPSAQGAGSDIKS